MTHTHTHTHTHRSRVFMRLTTGKVEDRAVLGGDPEVGGTSVKDNGERLSWSSNGNVTVVLSLREGERERERERENINTQP